MSWIRRFMCDKLGWHSPGKLIDAKGHILFDGCSFFSDCKHCDRRILRDSQGNWFAVTITAQGEE